LAWGRRSWPRCAGLYRRDLANPKRVPTPAQLDALAKATAARRRCGHAFGAWLACGCCQGIAAHQDGFFAAGSCAFEFRSCLYCPATEERHVTEVEAPTVPDLPRPDLSGPGDPSATTFHRAGSANHQNDSKDQHSTTQPDTTTEGTDPR
jgi:hypothetical protein